jgi:hypothetical protein
MKKYFKEWNQQNVSIIYKATTPEYKAGYDKVIEYHPEFNWIQESNYMVDTRNAFLNCEFPYVAFVVDDDLFVNPFSITDPEFQKFFNDPSILTMSCRMHPGITHCYTQWNAPAHKPQFDADRCWNWKQPGLSGDWCYPMSVASFHVFRKAEIHKQVMCIPFRQANDLEGLCLASHPPSNPRMICYETSKCICVTNNKVQNFNGNRHENTHPLEDLNKEFLSGKRLSPDVNDGLQLNTAHGPAKYEWR